MTFVQKQAIMFKLDHLPLSSVDGIWGDASKEATKAMQRAFGLEDDGIWGKQTDAAVRRELGMDKEQTGTFWDEIEYFTREEFRCQCGGRYCNGFPAEPDETMVRICDEIRRRAGVPILIRDAGGSGLRCPQWNAKTPGAAANSYHTKGKAADLHPRGITPARLYDIAEAVMAEMIPGSGGLGLYDWGIHLDNGKYSRWRG